MTFSPIAIRAKPFIANIVDYSIPYNVERSVVLTHVTNGLNSNIFSYFSALDVNIWVLFFISLLTMITITSLFHQILLIKNELSFDLILKLLLKFYGSSLNQGLSQMDFMLLFAKYKSIESFFLIDMISKKVFLINFRALILMSFWFIGILFAAILFSSELRAKLGLKTPVKQIDTIEELVNSNIKLIINEDFLEDQSRTLNSNLFNKLYSKVLRDQTIINLQELLRNDEWIEGVADGENAIFLFEVPVKIIITNVLEKLKEKCRFRYLSQDYGPLFVLTIASSKRLDKQFRQKLNLK
jgi:hypothetical protein